MIESSQPKESSIDLRTTWGQAWFYFLLPIILVLTFRWLVTEPFVIPSGSMIPNLLVHDHILVNKFSFGIHVPFSRKWVVQWSTPKRGDIVVFRYPSNPDVYYVKRTIGLPGDKVAIKEGIVHINGKPLDVKPLQDSEIPIESDEGFSYFWESNEPGAGEGADKIASEVGTGATATAPGAENLNRHIIRYRDLRDSFWEETEIPKGELLMVGDNRDQSSDSR